MKVLVVGAGFAGLAAAFAARKCGAEVTVVHQRPGASQLYCGAVDGPTAPRDPNHATLLGDLVGALGLRLDSARVVATREGVVRPARGADAALLDLAPLSGKRVGLVDVARDDWDARLLARAFSESDWARASGTRFALIALDLLEKGYQRRVSPYDFATSLEQAARPAELLELLQAQVGPDAWLFGPWLGVNRPLAHELSAGVGVPVGEVTSPLGGAAGARFEVRRNALLDALGAQVLVARVVEVRSESARIFLRLEDGGEVSGDALVLAVGGFVSGALGLSGALSGAAPAGVELAIRGLPPPHLGRQPASPLSSLFGLDFATSGLGLLEQVGLPLATRGAVLGAPRVFAAGDLVAPPKPTVGHALVSGLEAGAAAAAAP